MMMGITLLGRRSLSLINLRHSSGTLSSPLPSSSFFKGSRGLHTSLRTLDIFTVQDEKDFETKVVQSKKPVVVEFHATWCGPCKLLMPRMEKAMAKYSDKVDMAKVDIDDLSDVALNYNVSAVPSVVLLNEGGVVDQFVGLKDQDQVDTFVAGAAKLAK